MVDKQRRLLILTGTGTLAASAGCVLNPWSDTDDDTDEPQQDPGVEENQDTNETTTQNETTPGNETDDDSPNETTDNESADQNETSEQNESTETNETNETAEEEEQKALPDEEDTEIDRDQYEQTEEHEVEELPEGHVTITADFYILDNGNVYTEGKATNVSDQDIDFVDIRIVYYNASMSVVGEDFTVVRELPENESKTFTCETSAVQLDGNVSKVGGVPIPQNYVDDEDDD